MNPLREILLIVGRELRKNVRSARGIIVLVLTLLNSGLAILVCIFLESAQRKALGAASTEQLVDIKRQVYEKALGDPSMAATFASLPTSLFAFHKFIVWIGPLLVALLGFDTLAGDMHHKTVRYWTVRSRRWSYFAGKFLGLWSLVSLASLTLLVVCGIFVLAKGYVTAGALLRWGGEFWLVSLPISAAWTATAIFVSSLFRQPILALLSTFAVFFLSWTTNIVAFIQSMVEVFAAQKNGQSPDEIADKIGQGLRWYEYLYPNSYDALLLSPKVPDVVHAAVLLLGFSALLVAAGSFMFNRRDV